MGDWVQEAAKQIPALIVLVWIVWKFLSHLQSRDDFLRIAQEKCHQVTQEVTANSNAVMQEATKAMGAVTEALHRLNGSK